MEPPQIRYIKNFRSITAVILPITILVFHNNAQSILFENMTLNTKICFFIVFQTKKSSQSETIPSPHFHTPLHLQTSPVEGEFSQSNPQEDLVSNPVECDFTLSSLLEDTAGHSLSLPCLEWEVPRELLLYRSELVPPPVLGFERFEENKYTSIKRRRMI